MPEYRLNTPEWLWTAYKSTVTRDQNLDEPLRKQIAHRVAASEHVDPEARDRAEQLLEANGWH